MVRGPNLNLRAQQRMALTPAMRNALVLLRLPQDELTDTVLRAAEENPFLVVAPARGSSGRSAHDAALDTVAARQSLIADICDQIGAMQIPAPLRAPLFLLLGELRDDGYLDCTLQELAEEQDADPALLEQALGLLQTCEPVGIGARTLAEFIALRLADDGVGRDLAVRLANELDLFAAGNWRRLAEISGLGQPELERIGALMRRLPPSPVAPPEDAPVWRIPDLILRRGAQGAIAVDLNEAALPRIAFNTALADRFGSAGGLNEQAADSRRDARQLIAAIEARGRTLLRIGQQICLQQSRFFDDGPEHLVPVSRAEVAGELGLHPSTLGRAIAGKSLEADGIVVPLETFFSRALARRDAAPVSARGVQRMILAMVAAEPRGRALSDAEICRRLNADGVDIARRTVAKYRKWMRIPSSFERRRRNAKPPARSPSGPEGQS